MIEKEEFDAWLQHPVTKEVRKILAAKRADLRNEWEMSDPAAYSNNEFMCANAANIGWCRGLAYAEAIDYETYLTEMELGDGESKRVETPGGRSAD